MAPDSNIKICPQDYVRNECEIIRAYPLLISSHFLHARLLDLPAEKWKEDVPYAG